MENNAELTDHTFPLESKEYFEHLLGKSLADGEKFTTRDYEKIEEAYNKSHDIRKFEIELYWKRCTYFWTFISVLIAICGVVSAAFLKDGKIGTGLFSFVFCISLVGYVISLHFLITCLSGKQWQENWERHIDILEPYFSGNLYKLNLTKDEKRHSISLSNEIIAIIILLSWIIIGTYCTKYIPEDIKQIGLVFFLITTTLSIWKSFGRSKNKNIDISFNIRNVRSVKVTSQEKVNIFWGEPEMKYTNRIIIGLAIVLLTIVVLLLISTLYYSTDKKMELGSLTDWLLVFANFIMALSAGYAAYKAKDWLKAQTKTKGLEAAIEKISKLDEQYSDAMDSKERITKFSYRIEQLNEFRGKVVEFYIDQAKVEYAEIKKARTLAIRLKREIFSIERLGIEIIEREQLENICNCLVRFYTASSIFILTAQQFLRSKHPDGKDLMYKIQFEDIDSFSKNTLADIYALKDEASTKLDSYFDELITVKVHKLFQS